MLLCIPCQSSLSTKQVTPNCGLIFSVKNDRLGNFNLRIQFYQKSVFSYSVFASLEAHVFGYSHETLVFEWIPMASLLVLYWNKLLGTANLLSVYRSSWFRQVLSISVRRCGCSHWKSLHCRAKDTKGEAPWLCTFVLYKKATLFW